VVAVPLVFARNLQCELVRKGGTREDYAFGRTPVCFKRAGVGTNGILECKFLSENEHRAGAVGPDRGRPFVFGWNLWRHR
jgi:hypothetical protein